MAELFPLVAVVSRPAAMGGDMTISGGSKNNPGSDVVSFGPGDLTWRRNAQKGAFVAGEILISAVKDTRTVNLGVRTWGSSVSDTFNRLSVLNRAFEQFQYILTVTLGGYTMQFVCEPADYASGSSGELDKFELGAKTQITNFSIPTFPNPTIGGM